MQKTTALQYKLTLVVRRLVKLNIGTVRLDLHCTALSITSFCKNFLKDKNTLFNNLLFVKIINIYNQCCDMQHIPISLLVSVLLPLAVKKMIEI